MISRRNTIQKDLVRNTVYEMRRHVTANEVYEFIKEAYPTIGKGTVYRNLDTDVRFGRGASEFFPCDSDGRHCRIADRRFRLDTKRS